MAETAQQQSEGKLASALDKASGVLEAAGQGISQRPTAWTAIAIVTAFCARDALAIWWLAPKIPAIIQAMTSGGS